MKRLVAGALFCGSLFSAVISLADVRHSDYAHELREGHNWN